MTHPDDEYGEFLRRALHAEADAVMPREDGLDRIRARINERSAQPHGVFGHAWPATPGWLRSMLQPVTGLRFDKSWFTDTWMRSAAAAGAAVVAIGLIVSAPETIERITSTGQDGAPAGQQPGIGTSITEGSQAGSGGQVPGRPGTVPGGGAGTAGSPSSGAAVTQAPGCVTSTPMPGAGTGTVPATPDPDCPATSTPTPTPPTTPEVTPTPDPSAPAPAPAPAPETSAGAGTGTSGSGSESVQEQPT